MRHYELVIVYSPRLSDEALSDEIGKVKGLLESSGASTVESEQWGRREIAYKLAKAKADQGIYVCIYFSAESSEVNEKLVNALRITESALLYQVHRIEGKRRKYKGRKSFISEEGDDDYGEAA